MLLYPLFSTWAIEAMLLCAIAAGAVVAARHASAAVRHAIWTAAIAGLFVLPVAHFVLPVWHLPLGPSLTQRLSGAVLLSSQPQPAQIGDAKNNGRRTSLESGRDDRDAQSAVRRPTAFPAERHLLLLWGVGTCAVLFWLVFGYGTLGRIARAAPDLTEPLWRELLSRAAQELGVRRTVRLRTSCDVFTPCVAGFVRPVILLPWEAGSWTADKRWSVLLHELAHVSRHDRATQFLAQFACALLWFSPLHWYVAWRIRIERERACDDRVLSTGVSPIAYADVLLDTAKTFRFRRSVAATAVAMARYSHLEERLLVVLSEKSSTRAPAGARVRLVASLMLLLALPLGALRPGAATKDSSGNRVAAVEQQPNGSNGGVMDSVYARVVPEDGATELQLMSREIRYVFTVRGVHAVARASRVRAVEAPAEWPSYARDGMSNMRIVFPISDVHDVSLDGHTLTLLMEQRVVRQDGRENRGTFRVDAVPTIEAREFIRQFTLLKSRR